MKTRKTIAVLLAVVLCLGLSGAARATTIDNGDAGYSSTGFTSQNNGAAFDGDQQYNSGPNNGGFATWTFSGLASGDYNVYATWTQNGQGNLSTAAPYTISDGGGLVTVNQRAAGGPPADLQVNDTNGSGTLTFDFEKLTPTPITVTDGDIQVRLDAVAGGGSSDFVMADAVAIDPVSQVDIAYDPSLNTSAAFSNFTGTVGLVFAVNETLEVTKLGITTNSNTAALDSSQLYTQMYRLNDPNGDLSDATLLAQRNFTQGLLESISGIVPWNWRVYFEAPDQPLTLVPGETYVVASYGFGGNPLRRYINSPTNVAIAPEINHLGSRWTDTAGAVPTVNDAQNLQYQGPTFEFNVVQPVPEPMTMLAVGLGITSLGGYVRKRRRA